MLRRRSVITGALALGATRIARAAEPLQVFSADVRPLSIAEGSRRGLVLDVVQDAAAAIGREVRFTFMSFPDAMKRAADTPGALIAPFARTPQRETSYAWVAKIIDVPQTLGTLTDRPVAALVYQRRKHSINLFIWPSTSGAETSFRMVTRQGYHLFQWTQSGMTFWTVSDLNERELQDFVNLIKS